MTFSVFLIISGFLHSLQTVVALQQSSLNRNSDQRFNFGNFKVDFFQHLSVTVNNSLLLKEELECPFKCITEPHCISFNVAVYPDSNDLYLCELLDADKYGGKNKLQENASFHHYSPSWSPCQNSPCLNNGTCVPDFQMNSYQCVCKLGFNGSHCEACKFDFEDGIDGWLKTGTAFDNQPTFGDNPTARGRGQPANQQGEWWVGGMEDRPSEATPAGAVQGDGPQGTLTLPSFKIIGAQITFLIGGGCDVNVVRADLIIGNQVVRTATGACTETMTRKTWDVQEFLGQSASVKLVDISSEGWGHINFDDLKGDISCAA